jgi:hypothetical protein
VKKAVDKGFVSRSMAFLHSPERTVVILSQCGISPPAFTTRTRLFD